MARGLESYFSIGMDGGWEYLPDQRTRARWIVAEAIRRQARKEERSMKSRLCLLASNIENGVLPTKRVLDKIGSKRMDAIYDEFCRIMDERPQLMTPEQQLPATTE
jgi:hypothetical protein